MTPTDPTDNVARAKQLPIRALVAIIPVVVVCIPMLVISGYPPEGWPYVAGVFAICVLCSGVTINWAENLVVGRLERYARMVAHERGTELPTLEEQEPGIRRFSISVWLASALSTGATTWGVAMGALVFILKWTAAPPVWAHMPVVVVAMLLIGTTGTVVIFGGMGLCLAAIRRMPQSSPRLAQPYRQLRHLSGADLRAR